MKKNQEKNDLVKTVGKYVGVFALGAALSAGFCNYDKIFTPKPTGYPVPELTSTKAKFIKSKKINITDKIECYADMYDYEMGQKVGRLSVNGKVFLYAIFDEKIAEGYGIADMDGDGVFEKKFTKDELDNMEKNPQVYGIPPEWVLK